MIGGKHRRTSRGKGIQCGPIGEDIFSDIVVARAVPDSTPSGVCEGRNFGRQNFDNVIELSFRMRHELTAQIMFCKVINRL